MGEERAERSGQPAVARSVLVAGVLGLAGAATLVAWRYGVVDRERAEHRRTDAQVGPVHQTVLDGEAAAAETTHSR